MAAMVPRRRVVPRVQFREVADPKDERLAPAYALLRQAFHRSERVGLSEWRGTLREKAGGVWTDYSWHLIVATRGARVVGLATGTYLGNVNVGIIGYLAIASGAQASGLGTRLRRQLRKAFERDAQRISGRPLQAILGEVHPGNPWLRALARRPNVLVLDLPYFQPSLYESDLPSPFLLYYESLHGPRRYLPAGELRQILYAIWRRAYRVSRPLERPAFRRMLASLNGRRRVGGHPQFRRARSP